MNGWQIGVVVYLATSLFTAGALGLYLAAVRRRYPLVVPSGESESERREVTAART